MEEVTTTAEAEAWAAYEAAGAEFDAAEDAYYDAEAKYYAAKDAHKAAEAKWLAVWSALPR